MDGDYEHALRAHIRDLLLEYSLNHLTRNYVTFTQDAVNELLSASLFPVSTIDPTSLVLQPSVEEILKKTFSLDKLLPYDERWNAFPEANQYLKQSFLSVRGPLQSSRCWDDEPDETLWELARPMSPILTRYAARYTPVLGSRSGASVCAGPGPAMLKSFGIDQAPEETMPEPSSVKLEDALNVRLTLDPETYASVSNMIKTIPGMSRPSVPHPEPASVQDFLRADSPPYPVTRLDSPPIFSRDRSLGTKTTRAKAKAAHLNPHDARSLNDLPCVLVATKIKDEEEEPDAYKQHMVVVNGWNAYEFPSSPSAPSLGSSSSSEIDELFYPSPPSTNTSYLQFLSSERMDDVEIPRTERIGGGREKPKAPGEGQSFASFITPLICQPSLKSGLNSANARVVTSPKYQPQSPHTIVTASMLGQPGSDTGDPSELPSGRRRAFDDDDSDGLDMLLCAVGKNDFPAMGDPMGWLLKEKLDEKEGMLMDVPNLPPPNEHLSDMFMPSKLASIVIAPKPKTHAASQKLQIQGNTGPQWQHALLKKVKGLQSLNIELSWRPFNFGTSVPTDEEVSKVDTNIRNDLVSELGDNPLEVDSSLTILLQEATILDDEDFPSLQEWDEDVTASGTIASLIESDIKSGVDDFILTREERRRLNGIVAPKRADKDNGINDFRDSNDLATADGGYQEPDLLDDRSRKRARLAHQTTYRQADTHFTYEQNFEKSEDSGIFLADKQLSDNSFSQLADTAEGFDGLNEDGELFPDVDPVHMDGHYNPSPTDRHWIPRPRTLFQPARPDPLGAPVDPGINEFAEGPDVPAFLPLSFDSNYQQATQQQNGHALVPVAHDACDRSTNEGLPTADTTIDDAYTGLKEPAQDHGIRPQDEPVFVLVPASSPGPSATTQNHPQLTTGRRALAEFLQLRAKNIGSPKEVHDPPSSHAPGPVAVPLPQFESVPLTIPPDLMDRNTLQLTEPFPPGTTPHHYLVSIDLLPKRALLRHLSSPQCSISLTERESLGGAHLILDPDSAVLFFPLLALPADGETLVETISQLSWRFGSILILFEGFSSSAYYQRRLLQDEVTANSLSGKLNPFSPPVIKSVRKFRRDLSLADSYTVTKRSETNVCVAFALTVEEAAKFVRTFGNMAEGRDKTRGVIWGERRWLEIEEQEGEADLARVDGMNVFAAALILSQMTLEMFLEMNPEERIQMFGGLVGVDRIARFNRVIARRTEAMQLPSSSPVTTSLDLPNENELPDGMVAYSHHAEQHEDMERYIDYQGLGGIADNSHIGNVG